MKPKETILSIKEVFDHEIVTGHEKARFDGFEVLTSRQTIRFLISNGQDCCENWGYFSSDADPDRFVGAELLDVRITDSSLNQAKLDDRVGDIDGGDTMFVDLVTDRGVFQLAAYNAHNGYYGHNALIQSEQLNHEVDL